MRRILAIVVWLAAVQSALAVGTVTATTGRGFTAPPPAACGFAGRDQNALEARLFADAADGRLHSFSPLGAALVASGVQDDGALRHYEQKAAALVDELRRGATAHGVCVLRAGTPRQRVEAIFEFMHQRVLCGGYDLAYTDLRRVLDEGRFNCISAAVLFNYLAGQLGLDCRGLEMPGHAMSRVMLPDGPLDVETTCPQWFRVAGTLRVPSPAHGVCAPRIRITAREVTPIQMAAMIYYNRGVDLLAEKHFAEAAAANAKALRLDPGNATARGNLLATINNWSIELGNAEHFAEAVDLLRQGLAIDAKFEPFAQNYVHVHHQWVEHLCQAGRFQEATALLSRAATEMPSRDYLRQAQGDVARRWAKAISATGQSGLPLPLPCVRDTVEVD